MNDGRQKGSGRKTGKKRRKKRREGRKKRMMERQKGGKVGGREVRTKNRKEQVRKIIMSSTPIATKLDMEANYYLYKKLWTAAV